MREMRVGMAQINTTVGDFDGNTKKILEAIDQARSLDVDLLTFPELATCGYPPEDLLYKPRFLSQNLKVLETAINHSTGITLVLGFVDTEDDIYNAAAVIHDGKLAGVYHKIYLPNYGVFDEGRYFKAGSRCPVYVINGIVVGINICEDIWYEAGPATAQASCGAEVIVNISASPYNFTKADLRESMLSTRASDNVVIIVYNNLVGGQDELIFDGDSMILDEKGRLRARGNQFEEDLIVADLDVESVFQTRLHDPHHRMGTLLLEGQRWQLTRTIVSEAPDGAPKPPLPQRRFVLEIEELDYDVVKRPLSNGIKQLSPKKVDVRYRVEGVYNALVLGTRDYIHKNGMEGVVIGLSGGIDSALVTTIAVDALGPSNVIGVSMPSRYSSPGSISDAELLSQNLGVRLMNIPIEDVFKAYLEMLTNPFEGTKPDVTEENIQSRIRGNILMALSNKFGWLVLTTGNKSEMATGYCTLYGDMAGGFAVLKDVPKTMVYKLAEYRNAIAGAKRIPATIMEKAPSAELKPGQKDTDALPAYELLDPILTAYVEEDKTIGYIIAMGFDEQVARQAVRLVDSSEYKRRQSPPGIKITPRAFGRGRRLPITNRFKEW